VPAKIAGKINSLRIKWIHKAVWKSLIALINDAMSKKFITRRARRLEIFGPVYLGTMSINTRAPHLAADAEKLAFASGDCYAATTDLMQSRRGRVRPIDRSGRSQAKR
jgi:hypothetical protein